MQKLTKNVATIGPATETEEALADLIKAGMNVARFNTKHGTPEWHLERIHRVKKVAKEMGVAVGVLLDLQGPEIRINVKDGGSFVLKAGETAKFVSAAPQDREMNIPENVIEALQVGDVVSTDDGSCEYEVVAKDAHSATVKATTDITVKHRKTMNTPGIVIDMPSLIENDLVLLRSMTDADIDFVGLSFVRDAKDIAILRDEMAKKNLHADVIAKIENQAAINNLDEIIEAADGTMVARGDLAVEVPFEQMTHWQKMIIEKSRAAGKPVITATQMLESMTFNPRPTRAEVSDVANAVFDGTDAVMLSGETTLGKYPAQCVATQAKIAAYNEPLAEPTLWDWQEAGELDAVTRTAFNMVEEYPEVIDAIICLTKTGQTARLLSRFRPDVEIKAVTPNASVANKLALSFAVEPLLVTDKNFVYSNQQELLKMLKSEKIVKSGQKVLILANMSAGSQADEADNLWLVKVN